MTIPEFEMNECSDSPHHYIFKDGTRLSGVISAFFRAVSDDNYYFVPGNKLIDFQPLLIKNKYGEMKMLCTPVDIEQILSATRF